MGMAKVTPVCPCCYLDLHGDEETPWRRGHEPEWLRRLIDARDDISRQSEHRQKDLDAIVRKHADLTRQLTEARAELSEREAMLDAIQAALAHAGEDVGERLAALEAEVTRYQDELSEALRERDEARALLAETGHPQ